MKRALPFFSYLFHPIFIPMLGTFFYTLYGDSFYSREQYYLLLFQVIIITFFLPLAFLYLLRSFGQVDTILLSDVSQRKFPLLIQIILTTILIQKNITLDRFPELFFFFLGAIISALTAFILLYTKIKASLHMFALSALTFFVVGMSMHYELNIIYTIATLFAITGIVASSRLVMRAHTMNELMIGYSIGMLPQILLWYFWL